MNSGDAATAARSGWAATPPRPKTRITNVGEDAVGLLEHLHMHGMSHTFGPRVQTLRQILVQNYYRDPAGRLRWRTDKEGGLPPASGAIGVGVGDGVAVVAFDPGQGGVAQPVSADALGGDPGQVGADAVPEVVVAASGEGCAVAVAQEWSAGLGGGTSQTGEALVAMQRLVTAAIGAVVGELDATALAAQLAMFHSAVCIGITETGGPLEWRTQSSSLGLVECAAAGDLDSEFLSEQVAASAVPAPAWTDRPR